MKSRYYYACSREGATKKKQHKKESCIVVKEFRDKQTSFASTNLRVIVFYCPYNREGTVVREKE